MTRTLRGAQLLRWSRVLAAARDLAEGGGYQAVTMQAVAERAGVSRATLYRYVASRDQLLVEVSVTWTEEVLAPLDDRPPRGRTAAARARAVLARVVDAAAAAPQLAEAVVLAAASGDEGTASARDRAEAAIGRHLYAAIGDDVPARDRGDAVYVLGHVLFSVLVSLTSRRRDLAHAHDSIARAVRVVLPPRLSRGASWR